MYQGPGFLAGSVVKNLPANAGDAGSVPGLRRSLREGLGNPFWKIPRTEKPGGLQSLGRRESMMTEPLSAHTHIGAR